ncbi:TPA: filamentous hemagglutinin N-terminal domain-containing protein, partial [Salmonella enterica]
MNKIYKLKYDRRRNQLVAVSELTTGAGKDTTGNVPGLAALNDISTFRKLMGTLTPLAFMTGLVISMLPGMALAAPDLPTGGQIVAGQGSISSGGNQMTIHQGSHGLVTNWNSFDIGKNHTVQFVQPDSSAVALNRVTGGHESQILGTLTANGQVMLVNPAGVMFGKGAKVNTAGMLASTKNISTDDFMAGRYTFSGGSHPGAEIVNQGSLTTTKGGYIVLLADRVRNSGTIRTPSGKTVLAAADKVTLQLDNTGLASVSVNGSVVNALVENSGLLSADDGHVYLTARGKDMLLNTVVNNRGTVEAKGLSERGGEIVLDGGDSGVVSQAGLLLADSEAGRGGKVTVQGQNIHLAAGSKISATGKTGGGEVYVGGGWQGQDSAIRHASKVVMDKRAMIDVSARERGQGGTAVLWSDDYTNFRGTILARGGLQGGDGGRVETSSHHNLQAFGDVDASAVYGNAGEWLLDPFDISIVSGSTDTNVDESASNGGVFTPHASSSQVSNGTINARLNSGTNVTIKTQTAQPGGSNQWGNITVNADINHTVSNNVSLTLEADGNINITNHNITSSSGKLDVNLYAAGSHDGSITLNKGNISSNGGNIILGKKPLAEGATATTHNLSMNITNSTLNATGTATSSTATAGNISIGASAGNVVGVNLTNATLNGNDIAINASSATGGSGTKIDRSNLTALNNLSITGNASNPGGAYGIRVLNSSNFTAGNTITLNATSARGNEGALRLEGLTLNATNSVLSGTSGDNGDGVGVNGTLNVTKGNLSVTGTSSGGNKAGINITGANVSVSQGNLTLNGTVSTGGGAGLLLSGANLSASDTITASGQGYDSAGGGLNVTGNSNFSAQNTVLSGSAGRNNNGAVLSGNINVTQGNLSVSGTVTQTAGKGWTGLLGKNGLNINVSNGNLSLSGCVTGSGAAGASTALNLTGVTLNASHATFNGSNNGQGSGFVLNNTTLNGGIAQGANTTYSSCGSVAAVTNTLNINGGLGYSAFQTIKTTGFDNNTTIGALTAGKEDLEKYFSFNATKDWVFDASSLNLTPSGDKAGVMTVGGFT